MSFLAKYGQKLAKYFGEDTPLDGLASEQDPSLESVDLVGELLCYRMYDDERKLYENSKSFGFVLELPPLMHGSQDLQREMSTLIKEIGIEGSSIQCLLWADHRIESMLDTWSAPRLKAGGIYAEIAKKRKAFLKNELSSDTPPRIFRTFLSYSEPKAKPDQVNHQLNKLSEKRQKTISVLKRVTEVIELSPKALIEVLSGLVNFDLDPTTNARTDWNPDTWISNQVTMPGGCIDVHKNGLHFQGKEDAWFKSYEAVSLPDTWGLYRMGELIGDFFNRAYVVSCPFYLHYGIFFPSQSKEETKLKARNKIIDHQAKFASLVKMLPQIPREQAENTYVGRQLLEGEQFVHTRLSCGLWAPKHKMLDHESDFFSLFQKNGFKIQPNDFFHLPEFLSSLPMAWGEDANYSKGLKRIRSMRTTITSETGALLPMVGEWWGNSITGQIMSGRRGQISTWDPFEGDGNLNTVVVGPSGSGKSVFMQDLIMSSLGTGSRVFVLDLGRSFEKLCQLVDGEYIAFNEGCQMNLNPFSMIPTDGDIDATNIALEMVSSIVATMAMPNQKIDKERSDILDALVKKVWETRGTKGTIDDVIKLLSTLSYDSELMKGVTESLQTGLKKFAKGSTYESYFYGSKPVDFSSDLVVIETEELKNLPDLQAVILQIFTLTISKQIFMGNREKRCLVCIDEAWDLLKSPQMEGFIESLARRLRKYNGALLVGTQGLKDFDRSHGARAAFQNSNWLLMLGKDNESINIIEKENLFPMDAYRERVLGSLRKEDGKYSEIFIYHKGSGFGVVNQLRLDPFSIMLYSTKADEFQAVQELKQRGLSVEKAIDWLLHHRGKFKQLMQEGTPVREAIHCLYSQQELS